MEHRLSRREKVDPEVRLFVRGELISVVKAENMSREGIFLSVSDTLFQPGMCVQMQIRTIDAMATGRMGEPTSSKSLCSASSAA